MRKPEFPRFCEHDTTLSFWLESVEDARMPEVRKAWIRNLRARGFRVQIDAETAKNYPTLKKYHHEGGKGHLQFKLRLAGRHLELVFFQNLVHENRNGGQYDFDKRRKMPYLLLKQYQATRRSLVDLMDRLGYPFEPQIRRTGMDFIDHQRAELSDFQGPTFYTRKWQGYNIRSAAGREMTDGDVLYGLHYDGRLYRGIGYRHINNMWWLLLPCGTVWNMPTFHLWHRQDLPRELRGRFIDPRTAEKRLHQEKERAVKTELFERAAVLRDVLRERFPERQAA